jgi:hypothetical protein
MKTASEPNTIFYSFLIIVASAFPNLIAFNGLAGFSVGAVAMRAVVFLLTLLFLCANPRVYSNKKESLLKATRQFSIIIAVFYFCICWSLINRLSSTVARDLFELHKPAYYLLLLIFPLLFNFNRANVKKYVLGVLQVIFILEIIIGILQFSYSDIADVVFVFYKGKISIGNRAIGTFGLPYNYAVFTVFPILYFSVYSSLVKGSFKTIALSVLGVLAVFFSQSKTGVFTLVFVFLYVVLFVCYYKKITLRKFIIFILYFSSLLLLALLFFDPLSAFIIDKFRYLISTNLINIPKLIESSIQVKGGRLNDLIWVVNQFENENILSYFFGISIGKGLNTNIEFGYALVFFRFGLTGLGIYALFFWSAIRFSYLAYLKARTLNDKYLMSFFLSFHFWTITLVFAHLSMNFIDQYRLSFFFFSITGVSLSFYLGKEPPLSARINVQPYEDIANKKTV